MVRIQWWVEGVDNAYIVAVPGDVVVEVVVGVADEAVVDGVVEDGVGPATDDVEGVGVTHRNEAQVGLRDCIPEQVEGSVSLLEFGLVGKLSHLDSGGLERGRVEEAEDWVHCTRPVEGTSAVRASEGEGKYTDVRRSYKFEHWKGEDTGNPPGVVCTERVEGDGRETDGEKGEAAHQELVLVQGQEEEREGGDGLAVVVAEHNARVEVGNGHTHWVDSSQTEGVRNFHIGNEEVEVRKLQVDQVGNGVREAVVAVARCDHTNSCRGGHTECDQRAAGSGMSERPAVAAGVVGSVLAGLFQEESAGL